VRSGSGEDHRRQIFLSCGLDDVPSFTEVLDAGLPNARCCKSLHSTKTPTSKGKSEAKLSRWDGRVPQRTQVSSRDERHSYRRWAPVKLDTGHRIISMLRFVVQHPSRGFQHHIRNVTFRKQVRDIWELGNRRSWQDLDKELLESRQLWLYRAGLSTMRRPAVGHTIVRTMP
jgi:hypothetical protein